MKLTEAQIEERERLRQAEMKVNMCVFENYKICINIRENWKRLKDEELNENERRKLEIMRWCVITL